MKTTPNFGVVFVFVPSTFVDLLNETWGILHTNRTFCLFKE